MNIEYHVWMTWNQKNIKVFTVILSPDEEDPFPNKRWFPEAPIGEVRSMHDTRYFEFYHDWMDRMRQRLFPWVSFQYDAVDDRLSKTDPLGPVTPVSMYVSDAEGRVAIGSKKYKLT